MSAYDRAIRKLEKARTLKDVWPNYTFSLTNEEGAAVLERIRWLTSQNIAFAERLQDLGSDLD